MTFPASLDVFVSPTSTTREDVLSHAGQHQSHNDAIAALEKIVVGPTHYNIAGYPGANLAAKAAAAYADAVAAGGGILNIGPYSGAAITTPLPYIELPTISLIGIGASGTYIPYTGSGVALRYRTNPFTTNPAGRVSGFTLDGTGSSAGTVGFELGCVVGLVTDDLVIANFPVGWDFNNATASTEMERCRIAGVSYRNVLHYRFRSHATSPSFQYNDFADLRFSADTGETVFKTVSPAQVQDCRLNLRGNCDNDPTVFDLATASLVRPDCHITVEQTGGSGAVDFAPGSDPIYYPKGTIRFNGFPDIDAALIHPNHNGSPTNVNLILSSYDTPRTPHAGFGITQATDVGGAFALIYKGSDYASCFSVLAVEFGDELSDATQPFVVNASGLVTSVLGFKTGAFTTGGRPAANSLPPGTMIYNTTTTKPNWTDGGVWRDAAGTIV